MPVTVLARTGMHITYSKETHEKRTMHDKETYMCEISTHVHADPTRACQSESSRELGCTSHTKRPTKRGQYRQRDPYV